MLNLQNKSKSVAGSTLLQQHCKSQQKCFRATTSQCNINPNTSHAITDIPQEAINCLQPSPPSSSSKALLSTSPVVANYKGLSACSTSLFSFESGIVLSGSSGCCSLSNSPSSSSSSNLYLTPQSLETTSNACKSSTSVADQIRVNASATNLEESFSSNSCPLNSSLLAAVNGDSEDDHAVSKPVSDTFNQDERNAHNISDPTQENNGNSDNSQILILENMHQLVQQSNTDNSCLNTEDARALQLAVELTMMNLNQMPPPTAGAPPSSSPSSATNHYQPLHSYQLRTSRDHHQPYSSSSYTNLSNPYHMTTKVFLQTQSAAATLPNPKFLSHSIQDNVPNKVSSLLIPNQHLGTNTDERSRKSQNMTECVPVPSSEHVAEIVGRQGCKIKALRAKTNTYIKTPVRNEEPVFVVTGRKEDVAKAKCEILSAAEHFTLIRATRRANDGLNVCASTLSGDGGGQLPSANKNTMSTTTPLPGQVTIQVRVPYRVVGLVVGPKGNTIKHIQHETQTYIVTPSRDKDPIFEVTGMPNNVQMARKQIEAHIATRTGNSLNNSLAISAPLPPAQACTINRMSSLNALNQILNDDIHSELLTSICKNEIGSALEYNQIAGNVINLANKCKTSNSFNSFISNELNPNMLSVNEMQRRVAFNSGHGNNNVNMHINCNDLVNNFMDSNTTHVINEQNKNFTQMGNNSSAIRNLKSVINTINLLETSTNGTSELLHQHNILTGNTLLTRSCSSASSTASSKSFNNSVNNNTQFWKSLNSGSSIVVSNGACGPCNNDSVDIDEGIGESPLYSWGLPNTLTALTNSYCSPASTSISPTDSLFGEHINSKIGIQQQQSQQQLLKSSTKMKMEKVSRSNCWMCQDRNIVAALLPCGHKMFCYDCANRLSQQNDSSCPICSAQIYQAVRMNK